LRILYQITCLPINDNAGDPTMSETPTVPSYREALDDLVQELGKMIPEEKFAVFNKDAARLAGEYPSPLKLTQGDTAPLFELPDATGKMISLVNSLERGPVVLTFYRGVWCPYCNLNLKTYQQILPQIREAGASLIAVSPMTPDNSLGMKETNALQFDVLSDIGNKVARQFTTIFKNADAPIQAMQDMGYDFFGFYGDDSAELPVPATFVVAPDRTILFAGSGGGDYRERIEPRTILEVLEG
jgi:peroxiredoxin